jgi:hypothetical protein
MRVRPIVTIITAMDSPRLSPFTVEIPLPG